MDETFPILLDRARRGDREAAEVLLVRHLPSVRAFVRLRSDPLLRARESVSDLVQSACREVLAGLPGFRSDDEAAFRQWLHVEALHKVIDRWRYHRAGRRDAAREAEPARTGSTAGEAGLMSCYASFCTPSRAAMAREELERVERAFDRLPEDYREVIVLSCVVGLAHREIAARLGRTEAAVRQLLARARARLVILLD